MPEGSSGPARAGENDRAGQARGAIGHAIVPG